MTRRTHRTASAAVALVATILCAAPVWAAAPVGAGPGGGGNGNSGGNGGGGNQGSVRVVDALSGLESLTDNEPHVCTFFLAFDGAPSGESGDWSIVDWPPTGNGAEIANGAYAFPANGSFVTGTFQLDAGHYRVEWQAINAQTEKHKTFWVDENCVADEPEVQPEEQPDEQPEVQPEVQPEEQPDEQPEVQPEDLPEGQPEEQPEDQDQPAEALNEEPVDEPQDEPGEGDVDGAVGEPAGEPAQEPADGEQPVDEPATEGGIAPGVGDPIVSVLPDTAMPTPVPVLPGLAAAIGLLCLVAAHLTLLDRGVRALR